MSDPYLKAVCTDVYSDERVLNVKYAIISRDAVERAEVLLQDKFGLHDVWGVGGGMKPVRYLSNQIQIILQVV